MQEQTYDAIADAYPKDPWALISLVVSVMTKGALNDEVSDSFDLIPSHHLPYPSPIHIQYPSVFYYY
jgi:hypothetical protein